MLSTRLPPVIAMCASCGLVMMRSVLKRPCDLISSSVRETCFSNSATISESQITQKILIRKPRSHELSQEGGPQDEFMVSWLLDLDRKSTRLNSSHVRISYAVFCLK